MSAMLRVTFMLGICVLNVKAIITSDENIAIDEMKTLFSSWDGLLNQNPTMRESLDTCIQEKVGEQLTFGGISRCAATVLSNFEISIKTKVTGEKSHELANTYINAVLKNATDGTFELDGPPLQIKLGLLIGTYSDTTKKSLKSSEEEDCH